MASARDTTGVLDRGMRIKGQLTNLGEPTCLLGHIHSRKIWGTGVTRALATHEPHLLDVEPPETVEHKTKAAARYWEGSESEPTRDGQEAVLVELITDGGGEKTATE